MTVQIPTPQPIDIDPALLTPVAEPQLDGDDIEAVGRLYLDQRSALREANGKITATCAIVAEHNRAAGVDATVLRGPC